VITSSEKRLLETQSFCNCRFNHTDLFFNLSAPHNVLKCEFKKRLGVWEKLNMSYLY
jgi:hypothetical protein